MQSLRHRFFPTPAPVSLVEIVRRIKGSCTSVQDVTVKDFRSLVEAREGDLTALTNERYLPDLAKTQASACILSAAHLSGCPSTTIAIVVSEPSVAYALALDLLYPSKITTTNQLISPTAQIGARTIIAAGTYIGDNVAIGDDCVIHNNVSISHSVIGDRCVIHSGARIGQDGFGYVQSNGRHLKVPQIGAVSIGNDVEIGANTTVDRGSLRDTVIGNGCKIDNLVQIGHNVVLGDHCIVVAQVGISGSTTIGSYTVIAGQAGIAGHLNVGSQVQIGAQSGVIGDLKDGAKVFGTPAQPHLQAMRQIAMIKKLAPRHMSVSHEDTRP